MVELEVTGWKCCTLGIRVRQEAETASGRRKAIAAKRGILSENPAFSR
jgi:hypothetical protein